MNFVFFYEKIIKFLFFLLQMQIKWCKYLVVYNERLIKRGNISRCLLYRGTLSVVLRLIGGVNL